MRHTASNARTTRCITVARHDGSTLHVFAECGFAIQTRVVAIVGVAATAHERLTAGATGSFFELIDKSFEITTVNCIEKAEGIASRRITTIDRDFAQRFIASWQLQHILDLFF